MGGRNPDRIPLAVWRARAETVGEMRAAGWAVRSQCETCRLPMAVDLGDLITLRGPAVSLWGRRPKCRRIGCAGRVVFLGRVPGGKGEWKRLDDVAPPAAPARPAWLQQQLGEATKSPKPR